jgi:xanthine dehydrogenase accessory factor
VEAGQVLASILMQDGQEKIVTSPLSGALRGLIHDGVHVARDAKIGDVDPRDDVRACWLVSDKALSVAGGVLEAILAFQNKR